MIDDRKKKAAEAMGRGYSREDAARLAGVSRRTLYDWLAGPDGEAIMQIAREEQERTADPTAIGTLRALLRSEREEIRLRAALGLLMPTTRQAEDAEADGTVPAEERGRPVVRFGPDPRRLQELAGSDSP